MRTRRKGLIGRERWSHWICADKESGVWRVRFMSNWEMFDYMFMEIGFKLMDLTDWLSTGWNDDKDRYDGWLARIVEPVAGFFYRKGCDLWGWTRKRADKARLRERLERYSAS